MTGVTGYAPIGYHKNGLVASVALANGVTVTTTNDPVLIRRPASIQVSGPGWSQSTGGYTSDGAGNIKAIGPSSFAYDGASRLVRAEMGIGGQMNSAQRLAIRESFASSPIVIAVLENVVPEEATLPPELGRGRPEGDQPP